MKKSLNLNRSIIKILNEEREKGVLQAEMENKLKFSRSYISESLKNLERGGKIIVKSISKRMRRIWLADYFPGIAENQVRIGILRSSEYTLHLSALMKILEEQGKTVIVRVYENTSLLLRDLDSSILEIIMAPFYPSLLHSLIYGNPIIAPVASGGSAIISKGSERICYVSETSTMAKLAQLYVSRREGIELVSLGSMEKNIKAFLSSGGLITLWEPYLTRIISEHEVKKEAGYEEILGRVPCCVITFNNLYYKSNLQLARDISEMEPDIKDIENPDNIYLARISIILGFTHDIIADSIKSYSFFKRYSRFPDDSKEIGIYLTENQRSKIFPLS